MKEQVLLYFFPYRRLMPVLSEIQRRHGWRILTDFEPSDFGLSNEKFQKAESLVDMASIADRVASEINWRMPELAGFMREQLGLLPYAKHIEERDFAEAERALQVSLEQMLRNMFLFEALYERFDIRAVVCSLSILERNRALLAAAKARGVPTLHIHHGNYPQPEHRFPEMADFAAVADEFSAKILRETRVSNAEFVVTGLPFYTQPREPFSMEEDKLVRKRARAQLGIAENDDVVLYLGSWIESLYLTRLLTAEQAIEALRILFSVLKKREAQGRRTVVLLRQHPTIVEREDQPAFYSLAQDCGYEHLRIHSGEKELAFDAADVVITDDPQSSVVLDCFAAGRAIIGLVLRPLIPNEYARSVIEQNLDLAFNQEQLETMLASYLDNPAKRYQRESQALEFIRELRCIEPHIATENLLELIAQLARRGSPLGHVREL